jgi:hypothetical protein
MEAHVSPHYAAPHSTLFMIECGVERVPYTMSCVSMWADLTNERASLLRLLYGVLPVLEDGSFSFFVAVKTIVTNVNDFSV